MAVAVGSGQGGAGGCGAVRIGAGPPLGTRYQGAVPRFIATKPGPRTPVFCGMPAIRAR